MTEKQLDELLVNRLGRFESEVPGDMWDRIGTEKRKRRLPPFFFWLLATCLLLGLMLALGVFFSKDKTETSQAADQTRSATSSNFSTPVSDQNSRPVDQAAHLSDQPKQPEPEAPVDTIAKMQRPNGNTPVLLSKPKQAKTTIRKSWRRRNKPKLKSGDAPELSAMATPGQDQESRAETAVSAEKKPTATTGLNKKQEIKIKPDSTTVISPAPEPGASDKWSVEIIAGPGYPVNAIRADNAAYASLLKGAGQLRPLLQAGFRMQYHISRRFSFRIGLQYDAINEKMNFKDGSGSRYSSENRYRFWLVPLLAGYQFRQSSRASIGVTTGVLLGIKASYKGLLPGLSGQPVNLATGNVYRKDPGSSWYLGLDYSKTLRKRSSVFLQPWVSFRLNNMATGIQSFSRRLHGSGIDIGLRYKLFQP